MNLDTHLDAYLSLLLWNMVEAILIKVYIDNLIQTPPLICSKYPDLVLWLSDQRRVLLPINQEEKNTARRPKTS